MRAAPVVPEGPRLRRRLGTALLLAALIVALLVAVPSLRDVDDAVGDMDPGWIAVAITLEVGSCLAFVAVFRLFFDGVPAGTARRLAWTELASGVLLPGGGVSSLLAGGWLMSLAGMPTGRIVRRSSALFFLTSAINVAALVAGGVLLATGLSGGPHDFARAVLPVLAAVAATAIVLALPALTAGRTRRSGWVAHIVDGLRDAERTLFRPNWRLAGAFGYLLFDIGVLAATLIALGHAPPLAAIVVAYLIGYLANWVPIPGGVGVLDGGLAGALILYGTTPADAAAAVLVYHAIAFWIPGLGGSLAYTLLRRQLVAQPAVAVAAPAQVAAAQLAAAPADAGLRATCTQGSAASPSRSRHPRLLPAPARRGAQLASARGGAGTRSAGALAAPVSTTTRAGR
jgi:uncharacterized membrane protein YbhN (UPF0104 family)